MIHPFNLATAILRLLMDNYREAFREYEPYVPIICVSLQHFYGTWISCWYYMSAIAIIFRSDGSHVSLLQTVSRQVCLGEVLSPRSCQRPILLQHEHEVVQISILDLKHLRSGRQSGKHVVLLDQTWIQSRYQHLQVLNLCSDHSELDH